MLTAVAFSTSSLTSCSDDWEEPYMNIPQKEIKVSSTQEKVTVPIESNRRWKIISSIPSWITIENTMGDKTSELIIDVASNSSFERSCVLILAASTQTETIKLTQSAATSGSISVSTGYCDISGIWPNYTLIFSFSITNPHLASVAGIIYKGKKYPCSAINDYNTVSVNVKGLNPYGGSYQAYAINRTTGKYVYGSTKKVTNE